MTPGRQYVRDAEGLFSEYVVVPLDLDAKLPADATYSGYHQGESELWVSESDADEAVYVVRTNNVREVAGGLRVVAFDVVYIPVSKKYGCLMYLYRDARRVELPRPLGGDRIFGECVPGDPRETCALLHAVVHTREGAPERDPWLE